MTKNLPEITPEKMNGKIYFLRNAEGRFYNFADKHWYTSTFHASFVKDIRDMKERLSKLNFEGCEVVYLTEYQHWDYMNGIATNVVMAGAYLAELVRALDLRVPTKSADGKKVHKQCTDILAVLQPFVAVKKAFLADPENGEEITDDYAGYFAEFITQFSRVNMEQIKEVTDMLKAYYKNPKAINGISDKILRD